MAEKITRQQLQKIEILPYPAAARPLLKTGDLFFCSGDYLFSKVIRYFSKSPWSHVGIIYKEENIDRILFLESELVYGVRIAPLSKYLRDNNGKRKPYKGIIAIAQVDGLNEETIKQCISFGMDELTRPYDNWEIVRILVRILLKRGKKLKDRKYVCSEYVQACFAKAGIEFPFTNNFVSPDSIWEDERVKLKFRVL